MGKKDLQAFINTKKKKTEEANVNWDKKRDDWLDLLKELYNNIEVWLGELEDNDVVSYKYKNIKINEEYIGIYKTKKMIINIANEQISLEPIGTLLIGSKGRIDMTGKNGTVKLVLTPKNSAEPSIKVKFEIDGEDKKVKDKDMPVEWVWKIATPPPSIQYIRLNSDSFSDALLEVVGG